MHDDNDLHHSLQKLLRRRLLIGAGAAGLTSLAAGAVLAQAPDRQGVLRRPGARPGTGRGSAGSGSGSGTGTSTGSGSTTSSCSTIPEETAGPYPGDGSNTSNGSLANALALSGIVRSDIRRSFGSASATAAGVSLTLTLKLVNSSMSCANLSGYAVYLWHCDRDGNYSMYSASIVDQNYLRGVAVSNGNGEVTFTTIFPGCYRGRMPHLHFEVYPSLSAITSYTNKVATSQIALPVAACQTVYNSATGYSASIANLAAISFATDNVFSDGTTLEMATVSGSVSAGYAATLTVGVAA